MDGTIELHGFLALLPEPDRLRLLAMTKRVQYSDGETILAEADPPGPVFFMLRGRANVMTFGEAGRAVSHRDIHPGDVFGEMSALDDEPRSAHVVAESQVEVARMRGDTFADLAAGDPAVAMAVARHFARQIRMLSVRVLELSTLLVRDRLAQELARRALWDAHRRLWVVRPPPRHADLAARIGTHREAVTKELSRMTRTGALKRGDGEFVFHSREQLAT